VTPASLTVTANDASKTFGETLVLPTTAFTTVGLVNGDTVTTVTETSPGTVATASDAGSPYVITPSAATGSYVPGNYTIAYVDGKLALSRQRLRHAMTESSMPASQAPGDGTSPPGPGWCASLPQTPATRLLLDLGQAWWARQPLRLVVPLVAQAAQVVLAPTAQRHPVGLVLGAAAVGATLVLARPWRWLSVTALLARFLPPLLSEIARHTSALSQASFAAAPAAATRQPAR